MLTVKLQTGRLLLDLSEHFVALKIERIFDNVYFWT